MASGLEIYRGTCLDSGDSSDAASLVPVRGPRIRDDGSSKIQRY